MITFSVFWKFTVLLEHTRFAYHANHSPPPLTLDTRWNVFILQLLMVRQHGPSAGSWPSDHTNFIIRQKEAVIDFVPDNDLSLVYSLGWTEYREIKFWFLPLVMVLPGPCWATQCALRYHACSISCGHLCWHWLWFRIHGIIVILLCRDTFP